MGTLEVPGPCLLETSLLVLLGLVWGGLGWNMEQFMHWRGTGVAAWPLTLWLWGSRAEGSSCC